jgi:putative ABC transport system ATP-binding protein
LANDPKLIIADEPTVNLDIKSGAEVMDIFKKIHSLGYNIIMVTHDISLAKNAERIITIVDGRITDDKQIADRLENRPK